MSRSTVPPPRARVPVHVVHVLGGTSPGVGQGPPSALTCAQVRSLAGGLAAHGVRVTVYAPPEAEAACGGTGTGAAFVPAQARTEPEAAVALRAVLADADIVHAHGLRAATLAGAAGHLRRRRVPLVVSWHHREPADGARETLVRMLERRAARTAEVVLCGTTGLVDRARRSGARDARLTALSVTPPGDGPPGTPDDVPAHGPVHRRGDAPDDGPKTRAEIGAVDRPLILSVGRLDARHDHRTALAAARAWRDLEPPPLLAVAGDGPDRAALQAAIDAEELPVRLLGRREDALDLLRIADLALLPAGDATPALLAQEAIRAGVPVAGVAQERTRDVVGDAGVLTPQGDAGALAAAVTDLLADPHRLAALAEAARGRAASLPTEEATLAHVLSVYDELLAPAAPPAPRVSARRRGSPGGPG